MPEDLVEKSLQKIKGENVLITGATGFIGKHLVDCLKKVCRVYIVSRNKSTVHQDVIIADIKDQKTIEKEIKKIDINTIFHLAGHISKSASINQIDDFYSINADGTKNMLEICRKHDIDRFIYSSSMSVFGKPLYLPIDENHPQFPPLHYGKSKLLGELYCKEFHKYYKINTTILRYSSVYGPGQQHNEIIPIFITNALSDKPLLLYNNGNDSGDFIFVKDVVSANILAATNRKAINQDFNIGSGTETTVEDLAKLILKWVGNGKMQYVSNEQESSHKFVFNITKAKNTLGYLPRHSLNQGLEEQIKNLNTKNDPPVQNRGSISN